MLYDSNDTFKLFVFQLGTSRGSHTQFLQLWCPLRVAPKSTQLFQLHKDPAPSKRLLFGIFAYHVHIAA